MLPEQNSQVSSLKGNSVLVSLFSYPCKLILLFWAGDLDHYSYCGCQTQGIAVYEEWTAVIQGKRMKRRIVWDHLKALKQVIYLVNLMNWLVLLHSGWLLIKILSISPLTTSFSSLEPLPSPFKAISFFCFFKLSKSHSFYNMQNWFDLLNINLFLCFWIFSSWNLERIHPVVMKDCCVYI